MNGGQGPRLVLKGITKNFPGCLANDGIDLEVLPGEIHALLGENGAGKSTLVKIIYGLIAADAGEMIWEGEPVRLDDPKGARGLKIGMVFQHFSLFEALTVLENIALGMTGSTDMARLAARIREVSASYGLLVDPSRHVHELSVGERQRIEILRCLLQSPKLLIMDEPTSVLTPQEITRLFSTLRKLAAEGCSILYISHKLEEIKALCHQATVLRQGRVVGKADPAQKTAASLAAMMIGTEVLRPRHRARRQPAEARLRVVGLTLQANSPFGTSLEQINFELCAGEILGIAGIAGNGQTELMAALDGEVRSPDEAMISMDGRPVGQQGPRQRRAAGMAFIPEERVGQGAVPDMSLAENALLTAFERMKLLAKGGVINFGKVTGFAERVISLFDVRARGPNATAASLSGGNLQKFIIGREILQKPGVLIAAQPTWGVDAGAAAAIHQALFDLADAGAAVLVLSQDLDELIAITDRIAVLNQGRLSAVRPTAAVDLEQLGLLMGGFHNESGGKESHSGSWRYARQ